MLSSFSFSQDTVGFIIEGKVNEKSIEDVQVKILEKFKTYDKINLYLEDNGIESFTLPAVVKEIMFKIKHGNKLGKVALVTDRKWIKMCGSMNNLLIPATVKNFKTIDRLDAIAWVAAP